MDIQGLKDKILQLAIQGKLVEQDKKDEPASALLQRIKEERDRLVKEKKIRKQNPLPEVTDEEKPFEIPGSWEWVRFGNLVEFKIGKTPKRSNLSYWDNGKHPWFSISDIKDGEVIYNSKEKISEKAYTDVFKEEISPKGTLIMSFKLSIGKMSILGVDGFHNEAIISIFPIYDLKEITKMYLFKIMDGLDILEDSKIAVKGVTLNTTSLNNILIPLPPLAEQKRIVEKVDELFALIDELDSNKEDLLEVINLTRNQVLQEAIQGKLVEQNPEDERASVLLDRIKEERDKLVKEKKIRKEKPLPEITEEEKPFEIPGSWEWVRLGEVISLISGRDVPVPNCNDEGRGIPYIMGASNFDNEELLIERWIEKPEVIAKKDDLILTVKGTVGKMILLKEYEEVNLSRQVVAIRQIYDMYQNYLYWYIKSHISNIKNKSQGVIPGISRIDILEIIFPLPPLAEQKRIVEKVDMIMDMLDELEKELIINI